MDHRPTAMERAYELARSGACAGVADIKSRLRAEGLAEDQIFGPRLLAELRGLCNTAREAAAGDG